jgi:hypothetical protein
MRLTLGDDDVGVVEEPVDRRGGQSLREDRVEAGRVEVRGDDERTAPLLHQVWDTTSLSPVTNETQASNSRSCGYGVDVG